MTTDKDDPKVHLTVIEGDGEGVQRPTQNKLAAALANHWKKAADTAQVMNALAEIAPDVRARSRLSALGASANAHASRMLARLSAVGGSPLAVPEPVPRFTSKTNFAREVYIECEKARTHAQEYAVSAYAARRALDPSAAWVCELNRAEELDRAFELHEMATRFGWAKEETVAAPKTPVKPPKGPSGGGGKAA